MTQTQTAGRDAGVTWLVVNSASGSASEEAIAAVVAALAAHGLTPHRTIDCQNEDLPGIAALTEAQVALLVSYAGDGTTSALVAPLDGWRGQVLVLPGGTQNLLARALHRDLAAGDIIARLGANRLHTVRRTCLRGAGHVALAEVLAGPGATWSDVREGMRGGVLGGVLGGDLGEVARRTLEAVRQSAAGPKVTIADCPACRAEGYAGIRLAPLGDALVAQGYGADGVGDYLAQGLALLRRDFREGPHDDLGRFDAVVCRSLEGAPIALMIDGERATTGPVARFLLAPLAVDLLAAGDG